MLLHFGNNTARRTRIDDCQVQMIFISKNITIALTVCVFSGKEITEAVFDKNTVPFVISRTECAIQIKRFFHQRNCRNSGQILTFDNIVCFTQGNI